MEWNVFCPYPNMLYKTVMHAPSGLRLRKNTMNFEYLPINPYSLMSINDQKMIKRYNTRIHAHIHTHTQANHSKQSHPKAKTDHSQ